MLHSRTGAFWFQDNVDNAEFYKNKEILNLIDEVEDIYVTHLEGGNRKHAMKRLRVPAFIDTHQPWVTFRIGLFAGAMLIMAIVLYFKCK